MHVQGEQSRVDEFSSLPVLSGAPLPTWTRRLTVSPLPTICRQTAGSPSLRCQGCSHPPRHHPEAALSSTDLLRQDCGEGLSPPRITAPHGANRKCANISFAHEFLKHHVPQRKLVSRAVLSIAMPIVMWILGRPIATTRRKPAGLCLQRPFHRRTGAGWRVRADEPGRRRACLENFWASTASPADTGHSPSREVAAKSPEGLQDRTVPAGTTGLPPTALAAFEDGCIAADPGWGGRRRSRRGPQGCTCRRRTGRSRW